MESYEYVAWALAVDLPPTPRAIGEKAVRLVLVCLANHANAKGLAWPSRSTIASEVNGLAPRDVQNALQVLELGHCLARVESGKGKRTVYRLACYHERKEVDGGPRQVYASKADGALDVTHDGAADGAPDGESRHELNGMKWNPHSPPEDRLKSKGDRKTVVGEVTNRCTTSLRGVLQRYGIPLERADDVLQVARVDPDTAYPVQRLEKSRQYALQCFEVVKSGRSAHLGTLARCPDHPEEAAAACPPCQADWKVGDRPKDFIGRHWHGE